jgi:hypothetical protein
MNNPRILMIDLAYWTAISDHYKIDPSLRNRDIKFGIGFYLNKAFLKHGWNSNHFFINDLVAQKSWLSEYAPNRSIENSIIKFLNSDPMSDFTKSKKLFHYLVGWAIARIQVLHYKPDIIWFFGPAHIPPQLLSMIPNSTKIFKIAHISSQLPNINWFRNFDLMLSSQNIHVTKWRENNYRAELFQPAVDIEHCQSLDWESRKFDLSFVGGITPLHTKRLDYLERLSNQFQIQLHGPGLELIPEQSILKNKWNVPLWGDDLFKLFADSKISLNIHVDSSPNESANVRLLETTGCGSLLLTENSPNLNEYFSENEVVTYDSYNDLESKIRFLRNNDEFAREIASRGREKTLSSHTYDNRVSNISKALLKLL